MGSGVRRFENEAVDPTILAGTSVFGHVLHRHRYAQGVTLRLKRGHFKGSDDVGLASCVIHLAVEGRDLFASLLSARGIDNSWLTSCVKVHVSRWDVRAQGMYYPRTELDVHQERKQPRNPAHLHPLNVADVVSKQ